MKLELELLEKLFAAAKAVGPIEPEPMPLPLQTRILAHWHEVLALETDTWLGFIPLFRRAFICAGIVTLLALAWSYHDLTSSPDTAEAIANYEMRADLMP